MPENPAELLGDLHLLRRKVRHDRRGYALPLLLFAALLLISPVFYWSDPWPDPLPPEGLHISTDPGPFPSFGSYSVLYGGDNFVIEWYWMLGLITCFAVSAWWYRRHAKRVGIETDTRSYLVTAGAALFGMVFGVSLLEKIAAPQTTLYSTPAINVPILLVSAAASAVVLYAGVRWPRYRPVTVFVGTLLAMVAFSAVGVYMINGLAALLIIAGALLVLAWVERSVLLAVIGVLFSAASLHANLQGLSTQFSLLDTRVSALVDIALPAAVLVVGGVVALVVAKR